MTDRENLINLFSNFDVETTIIGNTIKIKDIENDKNKVCFEFDDEGEFEYFWTNFRTPNYTSETRVPLPPEN